MRGLHAHGRAAVQRLVGRRKLSGAGSRLIRAGLTVGAFVGSRTPPLVWVLGRRPCLVRTIGRLISTANSGRARIAVWRVTVVLRVWRGRAPSRRFSDNGWLLLVGWTQRQAAIDGREGGAMGSGIKCGHMQYGRHVQGGISEAGWMVHGIKSNLRWSVGRVSSHHNLARQF